MSSPGILWKDNSTLKVLYHAENLNDSSGNGNTLTKHPKSSYVTIVGGKYGYCFSLNDISAYLRIFSGNANIDPDGNLTISFWFYRGTTNTAENNILWLTGEGNRYHYIHFHANGTTLYYDGGGTHITMGTITASKWYHVVVTCTSAGARSAYLNGSLVGTASTGAGVGETEDLNIGQPYNYREVESFIGKVDTMAIWQEVKTYQWVKKYYAWATGKL